MSHLTVTNGRGLPTIPQSSTLTSRKGKKDLTPASKFLHSIPARLQEQQPIPNRMTNANVERRYSILDCLDDFCENKCGAYICVFGCAIAWQLFLFWRIAIEEGNHSI